MKKILTILAATATMFAFGDDFTSSGTSFEDYGQNAFDTAKDDSGDQAANTYWFTADADAANVLSNYVGDVVNSDPKQTPTGVSRPDLFASSNNTTFLSVETTGKLYRSLVPNEQNTSFTTVAIPNSGIYLDTLVKFTAADSVFGDDALEDGDKIAIEYVEHEPEETGDDAITNFVVRAGFIGTSQVFTTNYIVALPANFERDAWHRLTVRTLKNVDGRNRVGFKIYVDENVLNYITDNDKFAMTAGFEDDTHTIFPSAVDSGDDKTMISAVAFSGNGSIDDVVFTTDTPNFIKTTEEVVAKFTVDSGVTAISVQVAEVTNVVVDMTAQTLTATLPAGTTAFTVTATIDEPSGYAFAKMTVGGVDYNTNPASITDYAGGEIAITTTRNNFNVFDSNGDPISGTFQTLGAALTATGVAKIQLAHDYDVTDTDLYGGSINIDQSTTLDLNGKTLDGGESVSDPLFIVNDGNFVIIDSVGGGKVVYDGPGIVYRNGGMAYIGATSGDVGPTFDGILFIEGAEGGVIRGKFDATSNTTSSGEPAFLWADYMGDGDSVESECTGPVAGYWVVAPKGGSTTFALTTTGGANATVTTSPANVSALTEATQVTITATADQDYTYDGVDLTGTDWTYNSQTDAISMTTNISENTTVVVPDAVSEQSQEDWPEGQDLIDAEGQAAGDLFPGITNALATADAKAVATWAEAKGVAYADKGSILPDAFLLNCANTQAAIDEAAANFKITSITVAGDTVTIAPADGSDVGNGKVVIEGTATLSPISWHAKQAGDHFFKATLVVKPVATP